MGKMKTKFASPERSSAAEIKEYGEKILRKKLFVESVNAFPDIVLFLDKNRQVVFCNEALLKRFNISNSMDLVGKTVGEIFNCVNVNRKKTGCGTSIFCMECGSTNAIIKSQEGKKSIEECRMFVKTDKGEQALDLRVWAVPLDIGKDCFTVFTLKDIGDEKRRELLERTFFHDILNEASMIIGYSENVQDGLMEMDEQTTTRMNYIANKMVDTIQGQKDLLYAESGELEVNKTKFNVFEFLKKTTGVFNDSKLTRGKEIVIDMPDKDAKIETDKTLLRRIMVNLIKNALEASQAGDIVKVACIKKGDKFTFSVNNSFVMPENVKLQVFQRSFSTKGKGRGVGTYSVKLFTEQYLNGKVSFTSEESKGTTFFVEIPN